MKENGSTGSSCVALSEVWLVLVSRRPSASRNSMCHGFSNRPGRAGVTVAAREARQLPGTVPRRFAHQHRRGPLGAHLRTGSKADTDGARGHELDGKRQRRVDGVLALGESDSIEGSEHIFHVAESNPGGKLMARPGDGAGPGGRVEARQLISQEVSVAVLVEVGADIHQVLQQTWRPVHLSLQARAPYERHAGAEHEGKTAVIGHKGPLSCRLNLHYPA